MKKTPFLLVLPVLLCLLFTGCATKEETEGNIAKIQFTDALGQSISVDEPQRVAALMGSFADLWLLSGGQLAGVTSDALTEWSLELPADIPVLGLYNDPSLEALLALEPDLVLLSADSTAHVALQDSLNSAGIPAAYFSVTHFQDYLDMLQICTSITGRTDLYEKHGTETAERITAILENADPRDNATVLLLITYSGGIAAQSQDTMAGKMLKELGYINLTDNIRIPLREFSIEAVINEDPDYLLVIPMGNDNALAEKNLSEMLESHPAWNGLSAVKNNRYHLLPKELFLYKPNANWAESYAYLARVLADE